MDVKAMAAILGLPETATESEVLAAIRARETERATLVSAVGAKSAEEAVGAIVGLTERAKKGDKAEKDLEAERASSREKEIAQLCKEHATKLTPASKLHWLQLAGADESGKGADPKRFKSILDHLPQSVANLEGKAPFGQPAPTFEVGAQIGEGRWALTAEDFANPDAKKICDGLTGMTPQELAAEARKNPPRTRRRTNREFAALFGKGKERAA